ncbi:MAG TPA: hypothetical protein VIV12_26215 [Streptosporangiaceae bacterium]
MNDQPTGTPSPAGTPFPPPIRLAQPEDAPQVTALLTELGYPDNTVEKVRDRLTAWGRAGGTTV